MTLVLSLTNPKFTIQLSDRRLTSLASKLGMPVHVITDEANKAGTLTVADARLAYSFTGLAIDAEDAKFDTRRWLMSALLRAAPADCEIEFMVHRFCAIATQEFRQNKNILRLKNSDRRLSVMLSGFWNTNKGCLPAGWIVTNFQKSFDIFPGGKDDPLPWEEFRVWRWHAMPTNADSYVHIERLGAWRGVADADMQKLAKLLGEDRPEAAIIGSALKVINMASDSHVTKGTVGKEVSVIVIPKDVNMEISYSSETNVVSNAVFVPDSLVARTPDFCKWIVAEIEHLPTSESPWPGSVPRVHRKAPCPCGSGEIYQNCHRRFRRDVRAAGGPHITMSVSKRPP